MRILMSLMALTPKPKREQKSVPITFRATRRVSAALTALAKEHNLSKADVLEELILGEFASLENKKKPQGGEK
jgi:hypothetical protein